MDTKKLRQKMLDLAIRGKLVPQDPNDEPASVLLERIQAEKEQLIKDGKIKRSKQSASSDTSPYENVPFEIPESWVWTTIGNVCETCLGKMLDKQKNQGLLQPYLRNVNVRWGKFDLSDLLQMPFEDGEAERYSIGQNDLVVCEGGEPGRCAIWTDTESIKFQKALHRVRCSDGILNKYIQIILKTFYANGMLESYYTGSTIKHLTGDALNSFLFPLPPTKEQFRIVDEVEKWENVMDALDTEGKKLSSAILQTKSKILDLAIHGKLVPQDLNDEPAIDLLRRINSNFKPCDNAHYKNLPSGWSICRLEDIVDYEQPQAYIVGSTNYSEDYSIPVLTAGKSFIIGYTNETDGICDNLPVIIFDDFTTDSRFVDFPFKVKSSAMKILRVKKEIDIRYVCFYMSITRLVGDTHKRYWISEYSKLPIPIPPKAEQERIVQTVTDLLGKLDSIIAEL